MDLSLTGTGYCLNDTVDLMGLIDTNKMEGMGRIDHILNHLITLINTQSKEESYWNILVVMEDFSFASKGSGLFQIAGLGYIVRHWLWKNNIKFVLIPPTVLKKYITGVGNSDKNIILKEIYKRYKVDINDDNIGDAYVLSRIGRALIGKDQEDLLSFQKAVLTQLEGVLE